MFSLKYHNHFRLETITADYFFFFLFKVYFISGNSSLIACVYFYCFLKNINISVLFCFGYFHPRLRIRQYKGNKMNYQNIIIIVTLIMIICHYHKLLIFFVSFIFFFYSECKKWKELLCLFLVGKYLCRLSTMIDDFGKLDEKKKIINVPVYFILFS